MVAVESGDLDGYKSDFIFHQQGVEGEIVTYKDALLGVNKVEKPVPVKSPEGQGSIRQAVPKVQQASEFQPNDSEECQG
jgi:hypothetical protein